jgi:hypothetical protein
VKTEPKLRDKVLSFFGEMDYGEDGPRDTGNNAIGEIVEISEGECTVVFPNGVRANLTLSEIADASRYQVRK